MRILIFVDDETTSNQLEKIILKKETECIIETVKNIKEAERLKSKIFDMAFVDVCMHEESMAKMLFIQKLFPECKIVFISDNLSEVSELMLNIMPFGVIEKPLKLHIVYRYLNNAKDETNNISQRFYFMEKGRKRSLMFSNIIYLESNRERLLVKTVRSDFSLWMKMRDAETQFPDCFVRCHNSFLVNMKFIVEYKGNCFKLVNGEEIMVSRSKKDQTIEKFYAYKDATR